MKLLSSANETMTTGSKAESHSWITGQLSQTCACLTGPQGGWHRFLLSTCGRAALGSKVMNALNSCKYSHAIADHANIILDQLDSGRHPTEK